MNKLLKSKHFWFVIIAVGLILLAKYRNEYLLKSSGKYVIGETELLQKKKLGLKVIRYKYSVNAEKYKGEYAWGSIFGGLPVIPKQKYLILYSTTNPEISQLLPQVPVQDTINLDSLNQIGIDSNHAVRSLKHNN